MQQKESAERKGAKELASSETLRTKIEDLTLEYTANAGEGGRLFGSVTGKDIADQLARMGIKVDRRKIQMEEPIRQLGEYQIDIRLHPQVTAKLQVKIKGM